MKIKLQLIFIIFLLLLFIPEIKAAYDFEIQVSGPVFFTIGKTETVNIYVRNTDDLDSYIIYYTKKAQDASLNEVSHLVDVKFTSDKISSVETNESRSTFALVTLQAPIQSGNITFTVESESQPTLTKEASIAIITGYPINLPEFEWIGLFIILILATLILITSYTSHLS